MAFSEISVTLATVVIVADNDGARVTSESLESEVISAAFSVSSRSNLIFGYFIGPLRGGRIPGGIDEDEGELDPVLFVDECSIV